MSVTKSWTNSSGAPGPRAAAAAEGLAGVAGGHHDHHRPGFLRGDQVIEDEAGAADGGPRIVAVARAVQQVEDRELAFSLFVSGRGVDVHAAELLERGGIVSHGGDGAVRNVGGVHEFGAGNVDQAPDVVIGFADRGVARVDYGDAIHVEVIAVGAGVDGAERDLPYAVFRLGHGRTRAVAGDVGSGEPHVLRVRRENPEGDMAVGLHLGRDHDGPLRTASGLRGSLRHPNERRQRKGGEPKERDLHLCSPFDWNSSGASSARFWRQSGQTCA